jgi:SpoVK/Ycf46/Vps4 family AAA+-type ATPase
MTHSGKYGEKMDTNPTKKELESKLKPAGSYLDSLADFADLLGTIRQAENAAKELMEETSAGSRANLPRVQSSQGRDGASPEKKNAVAEAPPDKRQEKPDGGEEHKPDESVAETAPEDAGNEPTLDELLNKLNMLVGLENIKRNVNSLINYIKIRKLREEKELPNPPLSLHMVFMGNPGTGKTTVARILSELYRAIGVLSKGQLVEVDRSGLVAGFVGQTAIKTAEAVKSALGGILFIDEAYSLAPDVGGGNDFGREAIETLLKLMEDHRNDLIVIVAGYSDQMERFISSNPGLESRFNRYFVFEDYNSGELYDIFNSMCSGSEYALTNDAEEFAREHFREIYDMRDENFGNARYVRNFFENIVSVHSDRVSALEGHTREDLTTVIREDLENAAIM